MIRGRTRARWASKPGTALTWAGKSCPARTSPIDSGDAHAHHHHHRARDPTGHATLQLTRVLLLCHRNTSCFGSNLKTGPELPPKPALKAPSTTRRSALNSITPVMTTETSTPIIRPLLMNTPRAGKTSRQQLASPWPYFPASKRPKCLVAVTGLMLFSRVATPGDKNQSVRSDDDMAQCLVGNRP